MGSSNGKKAFTNAQYNEIYRIVNEAVSAAEARINKRIDDLRNEMNQKFVEVNNKIDSSIQMIVDILSRNGIK